MITAPTRNILTYLLTYSRPQSISSWQTATYNNILLINNLQQYIQTTYCFGMTEQTVSYNNIYKLNIHLSTLMYLLTGGATVTHKLLVAKS